MGFPTSGSENFLLAEHKIVVDLIVYLITDSEVSFERIRKISTEEQNLSFAYLKCLYEKSWRVPAPKQSTRARHKSSLSTPIRIWIQGNVFTIEIRRLLWI